MSESRGKLAVLALVILAITIFFAFGLDRHFELQSLKARQVELAALFERRPLAVAGTFLAIQIAALGLSIPGAVLTPALAAGAIFGLGWGTLITICGLTIGDSLGFLTARYLFRDWVERRFAAQASAVQRGVERHGAYYLLSLRLMAVVPFFIVNLTMGLTRMKLTTFAPVSFVGLLPATALYVHAGTQLATIERASDIYSTRMIIAFALLAALPIVAKLLLDRRGNSLDMPAGRT